MYTSNFDPMLVRFLSGLRDITDINLSNMTELGKSLAGLGGGAELWRFKIDLLCDLADPAKHGIETVQVMTDIDLMIYDKITPVIMQTLETADIAFQSENPELPDANIGVIAFRPSGKVQYFWQAVREILLRDQIWDQLAVNQVLKNIAEPAFDNLKIALFPEIFWAYSQTELVPAARGGEIILHHANCAVTMAAKWHQMNRFTTLFRRDDANHKQAAIYAITYLHDLTWHFGNLEHGAELATFTVARDGGLVGYAHPNEAKLLTNGTGLYFVGADGTPTTVFDEYYFDPFRRKILCVGKFSGLEAQFLYLLAAFE
jgi:hypothetical protein